MTATKMPLSLRAYLGATRVVPLIATRHLKRRVARGKEHPTRWTEKRGEPSIARPRGTLIWLHAVGLGEVLSLRGLITEMAQNCDAHFLVTSSTRAGAQAFADNAPPRTIHQFLPLDAPTYRRRFLDHWQPDLCIWAEQDIWPGFVVDLAQRGIPQCLIAARMDAKSYAKHARSQPTFAFIYDQMRMITAQDAQTADHLAKLGAKAVTITGSLKSSAPPLQCDVEELKQLREITAGRFIWATAPAHPADVALALAAHADLMQTKPDALLIIAPRFPDEPIDIALPHTNRAAGEGPTAAVWVMDTFGELGLVYRLAQAALIGGTHNDTEGHNPWEAVALDTAILHGPRTANFASDFNALDENGAIGVRSAREIVDALNSDLPALAAASNDLRKTLADQTKTLSHALSEMVCNHV